MSEMTKEILAELGLFGLTLPRYLHIPMMTSPPATDLLNIQFTVMDMLVDDPEIAAVVANHWNLALEIRAYNVQKQVWDILELDANIELPARASIQVIVKNNEPAEEQQMPDPEPVFTSKRDPRRKHSTPVPESKVVSKRDPRRKNRDKEISSEPIGRFGDSDLVIPEPAKPFIPSKRDPRKRSQAAVAELEAAKAVAIPQDVAKAVARPIVIKEPNIKNLSKNDPRRKRLLEKRQAHMTSPFSPPLTSSTTLQSAEKLPKQKVLARHVDHDSDSDEGNLQIDESFDEKCSRENLNIIHSVPIKKSLEPIRINESQLADSIDIMGSKKQEIKSVGVEDLGLWDEIYGVTSEKDSSLNIYDPNPVIPKLNNVKQMAKAIGLETFKGNKPGLSKLPPSSPGRVVNLSDDGDLKISVTPEKRKRAVAFQSPGDLTIDLTEFSSEIEIIEGKSRKKVKSRKSIEQLEKERELLLNLVKERDRMNEIVASVPLPDEIIIDKEIEDGELSDTPDNSDNENITARGKVKEDFYSPESPKGLQIDMDTEESEIDIIPLEREEVLLKHKKNVSKRKVALVDELDSDIEEIPLEIPIKGISRTKQKIDNLEEIEDPDKYKKYWEEFPDDFQDKSKNKHEQDLQSGLKKLSDIKSKEKSSKNASPNWALKSVVKTLTDSKSEETVPSQNFWKGTSGLSSYSEKIRQKVQERMSSSKENDQQMVENPFFSPNESGEAKELSSIPLPPQGLSQIPIPPPMRKGVALLNTPAFPPPVKGVPNIPAPTLKTNLPLASKRAPEANPDFPSPPVPGIFDSSIPPPVASFGFPPPTKASFPAPPPLLLPNPSFPPPLLGGGFPPFSSPPPSIESNQPITPPKHPPKVPSLLDMNIPRPDSLEPDIKQKGSAWLDPLLPQGRQASVTGGSGGRSDSKRDVRGRQSRDRNSIERDNSRRRSRSRDRRGGERSRRRSGERDKRSNDRDRKRRRSRTRSRSRDRRRPRDERRGSQDSTSSQDSGLKRDREKDSQDRRNNREDERKAAQEITRPLAAEKKNDEKNNSDRGSQEDRDNLMLCFYEGEDCMDDPGDPDLNTEQPTLSNDKDIISSGATVKVQPQEDNSKSNTSSFGLASCLSSLIEDRESKQLFPEPVPAISAGGAKSQAGSATASTSDSPAHRNQSAPVTLTPAPPAPPAPPSISGNVPPNRGEIYTATLGLANKHPVSAVYEYSNRMKYPNPWFDERWGPGGGWAYDVTLGPTTYSSPWFKAKKREAKMEACRYALQQLGIFTKIM